MTGQPLTLIKMMKLDQLMYISILSAHANTHTRTLTHTHTRTHTHIHIYMHCMVHLSYRFIGPCCRQLAHSTRNFDSKTYADNNKHTYWQYGVGGVLDIVIKPGITGQVVPSGAIAVFVVIVTIIVIDMVYRYDFDK